VIDVEPLIEASFDRLYPRSAPAPDWHDVLARAGERRARPLRLIVAAAAALLVVAAATPLGAAVVHGISDFSDWLAGTPGQPASPAAQEAFEHENARSWTSFPPGTSLRRLIATEKNGVSYVLYGFRSGDSLCLRLVVSGAASGKAASCAPLSDLRSRLQPALVIAVDDSFGEIPGKHVKIGVDTYGAARASASYGIVADGVRRVLLRSDDATREAIVANDTFLSVVDRPETGVRVRGVTALGRGGRRYGVPFAQAPFGLQPGTATAAGTLHGPAAVERRVRGGTIGWLDRRERRGMPLPAGFPSIFHDARVQRLVGRLVTPDPSAARAVAVTLERVISAPRFTLLKPGLELCYTLVVGRATGGGCSPYPKDIFARGPFTFGTMTLLGGDQYALVDGVASDDVATLRLYLGDGGVVQVPLRDNVFAVPVARSRYPIRLVAYDRDGRVIGTQSSLGGDRGLPKWTQPDPHSPYRLLKKVADADGRPARLYTRRSVVGGVCFAVRTASADATGCVPPKWQGPALVIGFAGDPRRTAVLEGNVRPDVVRLVVRYRSGAAETVRPTSGFVLEPVPHGDPIVVIDGYDDAGRRVGQFKPNLP
jgi:hypothetical protein